MITHAIATGLIPAGVLTAAMFGPFDGVLTLKVFGLELKIDRTKKTQDK